MHTSEQPRLEALKGRAKTAAEADELTKQEQEVIDSGDTCRCALMAITGVIIVLYSPGGAAGNPKRTL